MKRHNPGCNCSKGYTWGNFYRPTNITKLCTDRGNTVTIELATIFGAGACAVGVDIERKRVLVQKSNREIWTYSIGGTTELLWDSTTDIATNYPVHIKYHHSWGVASAFYITTNQVDILRSIAFISTTNRIASYDGSGAIINGAYTALRNYSQHCADDAGNVYFYGSLSGNTADFRMNGASSGTIVHTGSFFPGGASGIQTFTGDLVWTGTDPMVGVHLLPPTAGFFRWGLVRTNGSGLDSEADMEIVMEDMNILYPEEYYSVFSRGGGVSPAAPDPFSQMIYDDTTQTFDCYFRKSGITETGTFHEASIQGITRIPTSDMTDNILVYSPGPQFFFVHR